MDQETSETSNEIAGQVNKAVSEFREEASKADIAPIVKDLQRALEEQSQKTSTVEDYMQSSVESEKAVFADITRLSNSLGGILETQRGILESLKGLNDNIDTATQQQGDDAGGGGGDAGAAGSGGDARHAAFGGAITGSNPLVSLASYSGGGGGGGGSGGSGYSGSSLNNSEIPNVPEIKPLDGGQARQNAEEYLGREMSDEEYNYLIRATNAEAAAGNNADPLEQAGVMASILNRAREEGDNGVINVLKAESQFQAVTGTIYEPGPSKQFLDGPDEERLSSIENSSQLLSGFGYDQKNFTAADPNAYKKGTQIEYRDKMLEAGGTVLGGSVFNTSPNFSPEIEQSTSPLSLNWIGDELPEGVTEGLNQTTLSDPISGELFPVEFEVENVEGKFITTGPVTLTEDTDLEGVSGSAGDPVEVSVEIAQELAGQIGATIESSDIETPPSVDQVEKQADLKVEEPKISDPKAAPAAPPSFDLEDLKRIDISESDTPTPEESPLSVDLEPTDPETPATPEELGADNNIPETMATAVDLENPVMDNPPTEGTAAGSQADQTQTAAADYGEDKTTPVSFTGGKWNIVPWNIQVNDYFGVA